MATLERARTADLGAGETDVDSFDPSAVPALPAWQLQDADDLISLGTEQLFSGSRTTRAAAPAMARQASTPVVSEVRALLPRSSIADPWWNLQELFRSLGAAKHAFVFALNGVLRPFFDQEHEPAARSGSFDSPDGLLSALVSSLRLSTPLPSPSLTRSSATATCTGDILIDELQSRVDALSLSLPPTDADLARSLASLLSCIERLLAISRPHNSPALEFPTPTTTTTTEGSVYANLEREARALKDAREGAEELVGAARDVERAERDLLWGRVDDLSERVGALCRERAQPDQPPEDAEKRAQWDRDHELVMPTTTDAHDLPRYSTDHHPPAYFDPTASDCDWEKPPLSPPAECSTSPRQRQPSAAYSDKMARDLESVSAAIERLYLVSPQLANQRVEPDRRLVRERQLATLGNAIERLSRGRLDDQRAAPSPVLDTPKTKERLQRMHDAQLDKLIEQIDRAASRTLTDQRVDVNAFSSRRGKERSTTRLVRHVDLSRSRPFPLTKTGPGSPPRTRSKSNGASSSSSTRAKVASRPKTRPSAPASSSASRARRARASLSPSPSSSRASARPRPCSPSARRRPSPSRRAARSGSRASFAGAVARA